MAEERKKHPGGRPTKLIPEILRHTQEFFEHYEAWYESPVTRTLKDGSVEERMERIANPPPSILALHRYLREKNLDVSRTALYEWVAEGKGQFADAVKKGVASLYPEVLQENAMMGKYAPAFAIFSAKNRMGWTDRNDVVNHFPEPLVVKDPAGKTIEALSIGASDTK